MFRVQVMTMQRRLILLIAVTTAPLIAFAVGLVIWQTDTQEQVASAQASRVANAAMQSVDRALSGATASLQVLAASPTLAAGDLALFQQQASAAVGVAGSKVISLFDSQGLRLVGTSATPELSLDGRKEVIGANGPFKSARAGVTRLFVSQRDGRPAIGAVVPVFVQGQVRYALGASLPAAYFSELLSKSGLSEPWVAAVLDQRGTIIARSRSPERYVGNFARPEVWEALAKDPRPMGTIDGTTMEGAPAFLSFARSSESGWLTVVAVPKAAFAQERREQLMLLVAVAAAALGFAAAMAWGVCRRITAAADGLNALALHLEHGVEPQPQVIGIRQFDEVADKMRKTGRQLREREEQLRQSVFDLRTAHERVQREEANKDRFIATLAHELRNPLAPLRTGLHVLARSPTPAVAARMRATMERQLAHMVRLIDDLLDISRISRGKLVLQLQPLDVQQVIAFAVEATEGAFNAAGVTLERTAPAEPLWVEGDFNRLGQALINLLDNAAKFTPAAGQVHLHVWADDDIVEIRVQDTGLGIEPARLEAVFDMFSHVKDEHNPGKPGLGIGLPLARRLVEMHGGTLRAKSGPSGVGTVMIIRMPRIAVAGAAAALPAASAGESPLRVLVVDDNVDAADLMAEGLRMAGHEVRTVYSGNDALEVATVFTADFALLDIGMPGMNGYELCRRLRNMPAYAPCRIVAVTGWAAAGDRAKSEAAGFDDHLAKPVEWARIEALVAAVGEKRSKAMA